MPAHFKVAAHGAKKVDHYTLWQKAASSPDDLLARTWGEKARTLRCAKLLQNSLPTSHDDLAKIHPQSNGFVSTVIAAYNRHHHLSIRPDDVWMAILSQFNIYVNAHSEELQGHFVEHEGKKDLVVGSLDCAKIAEEMTELIDENLIDKELKGWILPSFTTTTHQDTIICAIYMMSTFKAYFTYTGGVTCGIPSVTLEGEKSDWENLLSRINKLEEFGTEPEAWAHILRPILTRFVKAFDGQPDTEFWGKVCCLDNSLCGVSLLYGWIAAFCVWNDRGKWQGPPLTAIDPVLYDWMKADRLVLDGVQYGVVDVSNIPPGFCEVDVTLDDDGDIYDCMMVSGHCATAIYGDKHDGVRPCPSWFMFIKESCRDPEEIFWEEWKLRMSAMD